VFSWCAQSLEKQKLGQISSLVLKNRGHHKTIIGPCRSIKTTEPTACFHDFGVSGSVRRVLGGLATGALLIAASGYATPLKPPAMGQVWAQSKAATRIERNIESSASIPIKGSVNPLTRAGSDLGRAEAGLRIQGITLHFQPSASQQADLDRLVAEQQNPNSSNYHNWLTPVQYAARFGVSDGDLVKVENWLKSKGFTVRSVNNSHTAIVFDGTVGQVESAFSTEMHRYAVRGESHLANATEVSIPAALSGIVRNVENLSDFRPKPRLSRLRKPAVRPNYTSASSGGHYVVPDDFSTIYDVMPLYSGGYDGAGQRIAIMGQSAVSLSDIEHFRSAAGLTSKDPTLVLVPNTGASTTFSGDESESDIDLEWSGAVAKNADVYFVYVGSDSNADVFTALEYAVDTKLAPILSISYGGCEPNLAPADEATIEAILEQANAQGQTVVGVSGDTGATDCDEASPTSNAPVITSATQGLAVDFPGSSPYVTGMGGTGFNNDHNSSYWNSSNGVNGASAVSYIPEEVWNETSTSIANGGGLASGGGGVSILFTKPTWQIGTGVPDDGMRDVPDLSLHAAVYHDGYLYCSSDPEAGVTNSCSDGFSNGVDLTVAGGTSFAAPTFAGILALINQKTNSTGQGNINPTLYTLLGTSAIHDITTGDNKQPCTKGTTDCPSGGDIGYAATTGYDQASGLGTVDAGVLAESFTPTSSSLNGTTTVITTSNANPQADTSVTYTATVSAASELTSPTGTVEFEVDGVNEASTSLSGGTATYAANSLSLGSHVITATYSGDSTHATSYGVLAVTIGAGTTAPTGMFTLAATNISVAQGSSGTSTVTLTSVNSYAGTVEFTLATSSSALNQFGCYDIGNATVAANGTATTTLTMYTSESACSTVPAEKNATRHRFVSTRGTARMSNSGGPNLQGAVSLSVAALAGFLFIGRRRLRSRWGPLLGLVLLLGFVGFTEGCGGSSSSESSSSSRSTSTDVPTGSYTLTLTGTDSANSTISSTATLTLTVD
jgi:subtilase family serine protease